MPDPPKPDHASGSVPSTIGRVDSSKKNSAQGGKHVTQLSVEDQSHQSQPRLHSQTPSQKFDLRKDAPPQIQGRTQLPEDHDMEDTGVDDPQKKSSETQDSLFVGSPINPFTHPVRNDPTGAYAKGQYFTYFVFVPSKSSVLGCTL